MLSLLLVPLLGAPQTQISPLPAPGAKAEASAPFSYYLVPSDEIGFKDCPQAFQVTFDGAINNGYGELDLAAGSSLQPVNERVKTLYKGHFPVVEYGFDRDGLHYAVRTFAAPPMLDPSEDLVAFERVTITNPGKAEGTAVLRAAFNPRGAVGRSDLTCRKWYQTKFYGPLSGSAESNARDEAGQIFRDQRLVFLYTGAPKVDESTRAVTYTFDLKPGESQVVDFRLPFVPIHSDRGAEINRVADLTYDSEFPKVVDFWKAIYARALRIEVDDPKVVDTMLSSLTYDLMARDIEADGKHFTQTVNKFQYHAFFARDTSFIARSYELLNLLDVARTTIEKYLVRNREGKVVHFLRTSPDDWGQSLWAVGSYFRTTGDVDFAKEVLPAITPHLDEFEKSVASDPLGLWPIAGPYDNELINGHYTSHNLWALLGLREAENLARAAGDDASADRAHAIYDQFFRVFNSRLETLAAKDDGYIPPGMDDPFAGYDWENASGGVYPFHVFPPDHPWVSATVKMEREYKYREGIMTWGPNAWAGKVAAMTGKPFDPLYLHDYDTFQVDETLLARGDQRAVVEDLYSTLVHTSASNGGFETSIRPWGNRDPDDNFPPHGWFAARYNELLRNMLLREVDDELHLTSALAPDWIKPGKSVTVRNGSTSFGQVDFTLDAHPDGADILLESHWRVAPRQVVLHIPWFVQLTAATVDGVKMPLGALQDASSARHPNRGPDSITLPANARTINLKWHWIEHPNLSYDRAVQLWLQKAYAPKPGQDTDHLFQVRTRPAIADPQTVFIDSYLLRLVSRSGLGSVHFTLDGSEPTSASPPFRKPIRLDQTTTLRAIEVYPDGSVSDPIRTELTKVNPHESLTVSDSAPGATYNYYEGAFEAMPDFASLTPIRSGITGSIDLDSIQHRPEVFAVSASGFIKAPVDGLYTFTTGSDDGSKLWIDGELVVDNDGPHAYKETDGYVALKAGFHSIRVAYFDAGGANFLHLFWSIPGKARVKIPAAALFHSESQNAGR